MNYRFYIFFCITSLIFTSKGMESEFSKKLAKLKQEIISDTNRRQEKEEQELRRVLQQKIDKAKEAHGGVKQLKFMAVFVSQIQNDSDKFITISVNERPGEDYEAMEFDLKPHQILNTPVPLMWAGRYGYAILSITEKGKNQPVLKYHPSGSTERVMLKVIENKEGDLELLKAAAK